MVRLHDKDAAHCIAKPLDALCAEAHDVRSHYYPSDLASYIVMRIVSYTNVCVADCSYCAFYRRPKHPEAYVLSHEAIFEKLDALVAVGGTLAAMEGGFNPYLKVDHYESMFRAVRARYGDANQLPRPKGRGMTRKRVLDSAQAAGHQTPASTASVRGAQAGKLAGEARQTAREFDSARSASELVPSGFAGGGGRREPPKIEIYGPTIVEAMFIATASRISLEECLVRMQEAGLRWIPGGGAEILTDAWRAKLSPKKYSVREYLDGMRVAQSLGYGTTATMVIGFGESWDDRIEHLRHVRQLQDETGGFASFLLWTYQPDNTTLGGSRVSAQEYLRTTALARLYLDNIPVIRTSILTQHASGAAALKAGAHDFDIPLEDQVTQLAGAKIEPKIETVLDWVRKAGLEPKRRAPLPVPTTIPPFALS